MKVISFVLLLAIALTIRAQSASEVATRKALFRYNANSPVAVKEVSSQQRGDVTVRDITFSPATGREVKAYMVVQKGDGTFAGILWVHWFGEGKSKCTQLLDQAVELAPKAVVSPLVDAMRSAPQ